MAHATGIPAITLRIGFWGIFCHYAILGSKDTLKESYRTSKLLRDASKPRPPNPQAPESRGCFHRTDLGVLLTSETKTQKGSFQGLGLRV